MKKWIFVLLALIVLFSVYLSTQSAESGTGKLVLKGVTFSTDLQPTLEMAKEQNKPVFIYIRSEYCGWCKKFEEESFTNQSVIKTLKDNFVLVSIDVDRQKNETRSLKARGTPTEIFLDSNGTEITRMPGYMDNQTFLNVINLIAKQKEA